MTTRRLLKMLGALIASLAIWLLAWPMEFGGTASYVAVSGRSMQPTYDPGDFVVAREQRSYSVGEIVVYRTEHGDVIHRIVGGDGDSGYVMQGDNNAEIDQWTPTADEVLGRAVLHVPGAGTAVMLVQHVLVTPPFPYLLAGFVFLVIVLGDETKWSRPRSAGDEDTEAIRDAEHQAS